MPDVSDLQAFPPMGGHAPVLRCGRLLHWPDQSSMCPQDPTWHVIWTADWENGLACDEHHREARQRWAFFAAHPYRMECSMPGAVFMVDENVCVVDEEGLGLSASEEATVDV